MAVTSYNGVKINRVKLENRLPQFIEAQERKAARCVTGALVLAASETSVLTPIATGTLINSRYNQVRQEGSRIIGETGYTAEYAAAVNDPDNPQNFRRATAVKDFLAKGFDNAFPAIDKLFKGSLRV